MYQVFRNWKEFFIRYTHLVNFEFLKKEHLVKTFIQSFQVNFNSLLANGELPLIFFPPGGAIPEFISSQSQAETKKFPLVLHKI